MKQIMRHYSTWLLIVGVAVSFFGFLNGTDIYQNVKAALAEADGYRYSNAYVINIRNKNDLPGLADKLKMLEGNVCISDADLYINDTGYYHLADIMIKQDEELPYSFLEGGADYSPDRHQVMLGSGMEKCCYKKDGSDKSYIRINGIEFEVVGILGSKSGNTLDYKVIVTCNDEFLLECMKGMDMITISYGSNKSDTEASVTNFYRSVYADNEISYKRDTEQNISSGSDDEELEKNFSWLIAVFAIINCIVISEFWILRRKQEIVIRKIWGYSNFKIFKMLYMEMVFVSLIGVFAVWIGRIIADIVVSGSPDLALMTGRLIYSLIFIFIASLVIVLLPIYKVSMYRPSEELEV